MKIDPENGEAKKELSNVAKAINELKQKEKKLYGNIFLFKDEASVDGFIVQFLLIEVLENDYSPALSLNS